MSIEFIEEFPPYFEWTMCTVRVRGRYIRIETRETGQTFDSWAFLCNSVGRVTYPEQAIMCGAYPRCQMFRNLENLST